MKKNKIITNFGTICLMVAFSICMICCKNSAPKVEKTFSPKDHIASINMMQKQKLGKYSLRGGGDEDKSPTFRDSLSQAINLSVIGKYAESKKALLELNAMNPTNEEVILQIAIQDFYVGKYANSIDRLNKVVKSSDKGIRDEAEIIMAQAALSLEDGNDTTMKWLNKIASDRGHTYYEDAKNQLTLFE